MAVVESLCDKDSNHANDRGCSIYSHSVGSHLRTDAYDFSREVDNQDVDGGFGENPEHSRQYEAQSLKAKEIN